jgi:hypothetical protein
MRRLLGRSLAVCFGAVFVFAGVNTPLATSQDPSLKTNFGEVKLQTGYLPDPYSKKLIAGGDIRVTINNVRMKITRPPDFRLYYEAGTTFPLSFYVRSQVDTTLLIHMPVGGYVADDDSGGNLNPLITLKNPPSGRYDIWVGTFGDKNAEATLYITELKVNTPIPN